MMAFKLHTNIFRKDINISMKIMAIKTFNFKL